MRGLVLLIFGVFVVVYAMANPWPDTEQMLLAELPTWSPEQLNTVTEHDIENLLSEKRWVEGARQFVLKRREAGGNELEGPVRQAVKKLRNELDDLVRSLDKNYGKAQQISPAFQWAQNSTHVFLSVKYAARWNAPGALEVHNATATCEGQNLFFEGTGEHSMIIKHYSLNLILKEPCTMSKWEAASVGKMTIQLEKITPKKWDTLLAPENPKVKYGIWDAMQERMDREEKDRLNPPKKDSNSSTNSASKKDKKKKKKEKKKKKKEKEEAEKAKAAAFDDGDTNDFDFDQCEVPAIYAGSKVRTLCEKTFEHALAQPGPWLIKFYDEDPKKAKETQNMVHIFKQMATTLPPQHCKIAVVNCKTEKGLCQELQVDRHVPVAWRYDTESGDPTVGSTWTVYQGEESFESFAQFAIEGKQTAKPEFQNQGHRRRSWKEITDAKLRGKESGEELLEPEL